MENIVTKKSEFLFPPICLLYTGRKNRKLGEDCKLAKKANLQFEIQKKRYNVTNYYKFTEERSKI